MRFLHRKVDSQPLDHQGNPSIGFLNKYWFFFLFFFCFFLIILLIYFQLCWVFVAAQTLSSERELLCVAVHRLLSAVASPVVQHGL